MSSPKRQIKEEKSFARLLKKKILIFDLETTGFPGRKTAFARTPDDYYSPDKLEYYDDSRIISIGWTTTNNLSSTTKFKIEEKILKPLDFKVTDGLHGINQEKAEKEGVAWKDVLDSGLKKAIEDCDIVVNHNVLFDLFVLASELYRIKEDELAKKLDTLVNNGRYFCTMIGQEGICKIKNSRGYKWPTLSELYKHVTGLDHDKAHSAAGDVEAVAAIVLALTPF